MKTRMLYPIASRRFAAKMRSSLGAAMQKRAIGDFTEEIVHQSRKIENVRSQRLPLTSFVAHSN